MSVLVDTSLFISEIVIESGSPMVRLAALELHRYWYARTGQVVQAGCDGGHRIVVCTIETGEAYPKLLERARSLGPESAVIQAVETDGQSELVIMGTDERGALYGAYRVCEHWGVYFHLHGDTIPDEPLSEWPMIDEVRQPLFTQRGMHPFHNFPEGPDAWDTEAYRLHLGQLAKMGMNFMGFHSYTPKDRPFEPQVWVGLADAVGESGEVESAYDAETWHPQCGAWNYHAINDLSALPLEMSRLVPTDAYVDHANADAAAALFRRVGERWADVFEFAAKRGVQTCLGLEIPLRLPDALSAELLERGLDPKADESMFEVFKGVFTRIQKTHPLDLFWLYIPEDWVWLQQVDERDVAAVVRSVEIAVEALEACGANFKLGVCGWVIGPQDDPMALERLLPEGMPLAALSGQVGHLPVSPYYHGVERRAGWAIPWLEDDPRLTVPQLWAGRMLRDAADAHALGCDGLLGIHWRTRSLAPQMAALARGAWDQSQWNPHFGEFFTEEQIAAAMAGEGQLRGEQLICTLPSNVCVSDLPKQLFETQTSGAPFYYISVPPGTYTVRCYLMETDATMAPGGRRMSLAVNCEVLLDKKDLAADFGHNELLLLESKKLCIEEGGRIEIFLRQIIGAPILSAIEITGHTDGFNQFEGVAYTRRINCGGPEIVDAKGIWEAGKLMADALESRPRDLDALDFYREWAMAEFGAKVGPAAAEIFARIDGNLPCITFMMQGPGNCTPDRTPWEQASKSYRFVDELKQLMELPMGPSERDRFEYWYHHLAAFRAAAKVRCAVAHPEQVSVVHAAWTELYTHLLEAVRSPGDLGTLFSVEQQWRMDNLKVPAVDLAQSYAGSARIVIPTLPSNLESSGVFMLKAFIIGAKAPESLRFEFRGLGEKRWSSFTMERYDEAAYRVSIPALELPQIFSYRVIAELSGRTLTYPTGTCADGATCVVESI